MSVKKYTNEEYINAAKQANTEGKKLYILLKQEELISDSGEQSIEETESLIIAENGYYVCFEDNKTNGTVNPDFESENLKIEYQNKISGIKNLLDEIDKKTIRALRANDTEYIELYEKQAIELRQQLQELELKITENTNDITE